MRVGRWAALLAAAAVVPGCSSPQPQVRSIATGAPSGGFAAQFAYAKRQFAEGQLGSAAAGFRAALRENPNSVAALNGLAATYDRLGRFDLSGPLYVQGMILAPESEMVRRNYALSLELQGRKELAGILGAGGMDVPLEAPVPLALSDEPRQASVVSAEPERLPRVINDVAGPQLVTVSEPVAHARTAATQAAPVLTSGISSRRRVLAELVILNGSGRNAAAGTLRSQLRQNGWANTRIGNAPRRRSVSVIEYQPWARGHAAALVRQVPFPVRLVQTRIVPALRLTIGASAPAPSSFARQMSRNQST